MCRFVPEGHPNVFDVTKRKIHNVLQGVAARGIEMSDKDKEWFEIWIEQNCACGVVRCGFVSTSNLLRGRVVGSRRLHDEAIWRFGRSLVDYDGVESADSLAVAVVIASSFVVAVAVVVVRRRRIRSPPSYSYSS